MQENEPQIPPSTPFNKIADINVANRYLIIWTFSYTSALMIAR